MTSRQWQLFNSYSLFIGHLHPEVRRHELVELFEGSGDIVDIELVTNKNKAFNFAFVRYRDASGAFKAMGELNGWNLRGVNIVVDMSKDTVNKLRNEGVIVKKGGLIPSLSRPQKPGMPQNKAKNKMFLTRLKEKLTSIPGVSVMPFLEDVKKCQAGSSPLWSHNLTSRLSTPADVADQLQQKYIDIGETKLGEEKVVEFKSFLKTIQQELGEIESEEEDDTVEKDDDDISIKTSEDFEGSEKKMKEEKDNIKEKKVFVFGQEDDLVETKMEEETKEKVEEGKMSAVEASLKELNSLTVKKSRSTGMLRELFLRNQQISVPETRGVELGTITIAQNAKTVLTNQVTAKVEATNEVKVTDPVKANHFEYSRLLPNERPVEDAAKTNHTNTVTNLIDIQDPSVLDFHVSPQHSNETRKLNETNKSKDFETETGENILDELFARATQRAFEGRSGGLRRSASSRSSSSEGANELDMDSGVETDCRKSPPLRLKDLVTSGGAGRGRGRGMLMFFN